MTIPVALIAADVQHILQAGGIDSERFDDATHALAALRHRAFRAAIIDLDRAGDDVFKVCSEIARLIPVLALTSAGTEDVCIQALTSGADDCVCRGIAQRELLARVRNVLRRTMQQDEPRAADLTSSLREMRVRAGDGIHELTRGETEVLGVLLERAPAPVTAVEIATALAARRGTVESRIKSLRRKLGPRLVTRGRLGYVVI